MADFYLYETGGSQGTKLSSINRKFDKRLKKITKEYMLANGRLRSDLIAKKWEFTFSWEWLPWHDNLVPDGGMGVESLDDLVNTNNTLVLKVPLDNGSYSTYTVYVASGSYKKAYQLTKKSPLSQYTWDAIELFTWDELEATGWIWDNVSWWNVSLTLEEA